jgi:putative nucleotidyltransferase with HDIG domain
MVRLQKKEEPKAKIAVLCGNLKELPELIETLEEARFSVTMAMSGGDAVKLLRERNFDALIIGTDLERVSPLDFLEKARDFVPRVMRVLYEESEVKADPSDVINAASPEVWLTRPVDTEYLEARIIAWRKIIAQAPRQPAPQPANMYSQKDVVQFKARITTLEKENTRLEKEIARLKNTDSRKGNTLTAKTPQVNMDALSMLTGESQEKKAAAAQAAGSQNAINMGGNTIVEATTGINHLQGQESEAHEISPEALSVIERLDQLMDRPDVHLPVLPAIGMEVQKLVSDENVSFEQIAEKVSLDPSMSARILEVSNSPLYAGIEQIKSIEGAVSRIGIRETRNILQAVVAEGLFKTPDKHLEAIMTALWMHSLAVAYGNEILAKTLFIAESQDFFMVGLLHDIGKLLIVHLLQEGLKENVFTKGEVSDETLKEVFIAHHNTIGLKLMERWQYPESFQQVIELHNDDANVYQYDEPVVVTYYANLLARKVGISLRPHVEALLDNKQIAQAMNMSDSARNEVGEKLSNMVEKIKQSYLK